jgi:hypothetical protein
MHAELEACGAVLLLLHVATCNSSSWVLMPKCRFYG